MVELSVGEVSGLVAAGVFVVQIFVPLAVPAILIAFISEENNLVTWSVLGRYLRSSFWPTILSTDTAADTGVRRRVYRTGWIQTIALILVSIASIVTPLGLYDVIKPAESQTKTPFSYIKDPSAFGYGTPPRSDSPFTRVCGAAQIACPGTTIEQNCTTKGLLEQCVTDYDEKIPQDLKGIFINGLSSFGATVSSIFDIQWRTYQNGTDPIIGSYLGSAFRQLSLLILSESVKAYEGLIVDMKVGGIGFRHHTAPVEDFEYGSTWNEDILFIEPETQCVNLNLTLDFTLVVDGTSNNFVDNLVLTDRGGFSALVRTSPTYDTPPNGQDLNLEERAYKAAWLNNFYTMQYFNVTGPDRSNITRVDSKENATFPIGSTLDKIAFVVNQDVIRSNMVFGQYLNLNYSQPTGNGTDTHTNPFNITLDHFVFVTSTCAGTTISSPANINSSLVGCSLLYGAGRRTDGGSSLIFDPKSPWSVPIYSCATAVKATVRTVSFRYNGTGLNALTINETQPKSYLNPSSLPLWTVEDLQPPMTISMATPLWGIVGQANSTLPSTPYNLSTIAKESLYLPGFLDRYYYKGLLPNPTDSGQNLPGVDFYAQSLANALGIVPPGTSGYNGLADYSGRTSLALFAKWQQLSSTAAGASRILNLVWTDVAANTVVGTKGWGLTSVAAAGAGAKSAKRAVGTADAGHVEVPIVVYEKYIRYRLPFAVPAFIVLSLTTVVLSALIVLSVVGRTGPTKMRRFLEDTSVGRAMGVLLWPEKKKRLGTDEWTEAVGTRNVTVGREGIEKEEESLVDGDERESGERRESGEEDVQKTSVAVSESREVGVRDENGVSP